MVDDARKSLRGRPGLRRELASLGKNRGEEIQNRLAPVARIPGLYRRNLEQILETERAARPVEQRMAIEEQMRSPNLTGSQREQLTRNLAENQAGHGTLAAQRDPYRWGSIAQQRFGSLYRR